MSCVRYAPVPLSTSPASIAVRTCWMSAPDNVVPSITILRPL
jgi:hypothetical protein